MRLRWEDADESHTEGNPSTGDNEGNEEDTKLTPEIPISQNLLRALLPSLPSVKFSDSVHTLEKSAEF